MDKKALQNKLMQLYSKDSVANIAKSITTLKTTEALISLLKHDDITVAKKAAWVMSHAYDLKNKFIIRFKKELLLILFTTENDAIKRNILRTFQFEDLLIEYEAQFFDFGITLLLNPHEKVASKAFALSSLTKICKKYPELSIEFKAVCESCLNDASSGLRNRLLKTLKEF